MSIELYNSLRMFRFSEIFVVTFMQLSGVCILCDGKVCFVAVNFVCCVFL
jgi:hypothetical protein